MARIKSGKKIIGFASFVRVPGLDKTSFWKRVGFLFNSRGEARSYLKQEFSAGIHKVEALRVRQDMRLPGQSWSDHKA